MATSESSLPVRYNRYEALTRGGMLILAVLLGLVLAIDLYSAWRTTGLHFSHDEAEHLHVIFALIRGEVPYRDFIENHPVLLHAIVAAIAESIGIVDEVTIFQFGKAAVLFFASATFGLAVAGLRRFGEIGSTTTAVALVVVVLALSGVWQPVPHWYWGTYSLWHFRPDWVCLFFASACLFLHVSYFRGVIFGQMVKYRVLLTAAACGGLSTAVMAKSAYMFLPYGIWAAAWVLDRTVLHKERLPRALAITLARDNVLFIVAGATIFMAGVFVELTLTGATAGEYWKANFVLNSTKHLVFSREDHNPANVLRVFFGMGILPLAILVILTCFEFSVSRLQGQWSRLGFMQFLLIVMFINAMIPAYTNGQVWPHYMIPSLLALVCAATLTLDRAVGWLGDVLGHAAAIEVRLIGPAGGKLCILALMVASLWGMLLRLDSALERLDDARHNQQLFKLVLGDSSLGNSLPDSLLPKEFTYLVFSPAVKPVSARAWGYYFMLSVDQDMWQHVHGLGLGPDADTHWKALFINAPPDAVAVGSRKAFDSKRRDLMRDQQMDIGWMWQYLSTDYVCLRRKTIRMFFRKGLLGEKSLTDWVECDGDLDAENGEGNGPAPPQFRSRPRGTYR